MSWFILLLSLIFSFFNPPLLAEEKPLSGIAAVVNNNPITLAELRSKLTATKTDKENFGKILDLMIEESLVSSEIKKRNLAASDSEIDEAINQIRQQNGISSDSELVEKLSEQGLTLAQLRTNMKEQIERSKFVNYVMGAKIKINDEDIQMYYNNQYLKGGPTGEGFKKYRLRNIFFKTSEDEKVKKARKEKLKQIAEQIRKKGNFEKTATKESESPNSSKGGLLGEFSMDELQPAFVAAVENLKIGEISDVVTTRDGFYIFKLDAITQDKPRELESLREEIRQKLYNQEVNRYFKVWLEQAKDKGVIEVRIKNPAEL